MIIEKLTLHDFGIYRGRHEIDLRPVSSERPIILIGARNGRGKTTILDAVNLVLFGQRARLSNRKSAAWDKYLRECINRQAKQSAMVGLSFTIEDDLESRHYEIARSWEVSGKSLREFFDVSVNGNVDKVLAEDWDDHVEGLLPLDVASLNFFDGEKIDRLADPSESKNVIGAAVRGLLGLGVLERLEGDLKVLLRRKQDEVIGDEKSESLVDLEREMETLTIRRSDVLLELAQVQGHLDRNLEVTRRVEDRAKSLGADKWEQRAGLEQLHRELLGRRTVVESELQSLAEGVAPLLLVTDLLQRSAAQMQLDEQILTNTRLLDELRSRDQHILAQLDPTHARAVALILEQDRSERERATAMPIVHRSADRMMTLIANTIKELGVADRPTDLLTELDDLDARISETERLLMSVPTESQLADVLQELGAVRSQAESLNQQHDSLSMEVDHLSQTIDRLSLALDRERNAAIESKKEDLENARIREFAEKALETTALLARETVSRNLMQIEAAIYRRFRDLIGKKDLISSIRIDPVTLEISVESESGELIPIERLSAGERQLLATATLWGLSSVAGRSIPLIIDTPLGRLDGDHRLNLADNYFPQAAHQVIILSTDSEFDGALHKRIAGSIGREYLVEFHDELEGSSISPGYFPEVA